MSSLACRGHVVVVYVVEFVYVLFALTEKPHFGEPIVEYVAKVVVFECRLASNLACERVVSLWVERVEASTSCVGVLAEVARCGVGDWGVGAVAKGS